MIVDLHQLRRLNTRCIEYKYVLVQEGEEVKWETIQGNRTLFMDVQTVGPGQSLFIEDEYGRGEANQCVLAQTINEVPDSIEKKRMLKKTFSLSGNIQLNKQTLPEVPTQILEELFRRFLS